MENSFQVLDDCMIITHTPERDKKNAAVCFWAARTGKDQQPGSILGFSGRLAFHRKSTAAQQMR
jgi:hypothetical protein